MRDTKLTELFEEALAREPAHDVPAYEDVARGRRLRSRRHRRRAGGVGVLVAAAVAGLALPSSPVSVVDRNVADSAQTDESGERNVLSPEVADDPLKREMWEAVDSALPPDVKLAEDSMVYGDGPGPGLYLSLERGDAWFTMSIWMQNARPGLEPIRPCTDPEALGGLVGEAELCEQGYDADGRWRVLAELPSGQAAVTILEGGSASVTMRWGSAGVEIGEDGSGTPSDETTLTNDEADAVADAIWSVGSGHTEDELASGIDLEATAESWSQIRAAAESELGLGTLTPVGRSSGTGSDPVVDFEDPEFQTGNVSAHYVTEDGVDVEVVVWQKDRVYDTFCTSVTDTCVPLPGYGTDMPKSQSNRDAGAGHGVNGSLGVRAGSAVYVGSSDPALNEATAVTAVTIEELIPILTPGS